MYYFIVNPHASDGKGLRVWKQVQKKLSDFTKAQRYEVFLTEKVGDAREFARKITERCRDPKTLVVIGGDGTLNEVVDGSCLNSDNVSISFIPTGVANDFARNFKANIAVPKLLERLFTKEKEKKIDYGVMDSAFGNRRFVVGAGIGFDAAVFHEIFSQRCACSKQKPRRVYSARINYFMTFVRKLKKAKQTKGYILLDQERRIEFNNIIFISSHIIPYESGYLLGSGANCEDGCLDLVVVSTKRKRRLLWIMIASLLGIHKRMSGVHCYRCQEAVIHTEEALPVHTDGEVLGEWNDITLRCVPRKLRIRV